MKPTWLSRVAAASPMKASQVIETILFISGTSFRICSEFSDCIIDIKLIDITILI